MHEDDERLTRLRGLVVRLERLPESAHRDWMLGQVRARMVDVDTGFPPEPLRPRRDVESERAAARPAQRRATTPPKPVGDAGVKAAKAAPAQQPSPAASVPVEDGAGERRDGSESGLDSIDIGEVLSLEDSPDDTVSPPSSGLPGWRRGLRG
jgi:hypothetical protein